MYTKRERKERTMKDENTLYWIWLAERCGAASRAFGRLIARHSDPFELYRMDEEEIERIEGIDGRLKEKLCDKALDSAYSILRYCKNQGVDIISYADARYPQRLRNIEDPPVLLYALGTLPDFNRRLCIGMVGTRKMSEYGKESAYRIAYEAASAGAVIVSGMALGIDAISACGALESGGETVAVLGCGMGIVYPKEHKRLMSAIVRNGVVLTEYPPMERPNGYHFPQRNRIISGLCQGTLIVEGAKGSGALITAGHAIAQGREVFALPGQVDEINSDGPNDLIRQGAHVALCAEDILHFYDFLYQDVLYYGALKNAKAHAALSDAVLEAYGVAVSHVAQTRGKVRPTPKTSEGNDARDVFKKEKAKKPKEIKKETVADRSAALLASLDETVRRIFEGLPLDRAVSPDVLVAQGFDIGTVMMALTTLEIYGLVLSLPGGMYMRQ